MTQKFDNSDDFSGVMTAEKYYREINMCPPLKSGDKHLDSLLDGGFRKGLVHLLIGSKNKNTKILLRTAVRALIPKSNGGLGIQKVAYIDGNNRFNPYLLSKTALSLNMNPSNVLSRIFVSRAFNWSQMVEIAELKLSKLKGIGLVLLSGITSMFEVGGGSSGNLNQKSFNDLKSAINGIKRTILQNKPIVIITAPKHKKSLHKPVGGKILTHFGCVIVEFIERERYIDYILAQHPFMAHKRVIKWNRISDKIMSRYTKWNTDQQRSGSEQDQKKKTTDLNGWKDAINQPKSPGYTKEVKNLRLKSKRNRTGQKREQNQSQNLTLDYYLKKK
ncbi:MAG: hypothetical protein ACTSWY_01185 [Promethearchaeota archaeon]